jgi:hypothetical protein
MREYCGDLRDGGELPTAPASMYALRVNVSAVIADNYEELCARGGPFNSIAPWQNQEPVQVQDD